MTFVDLHAHSTASDGTLAPRDVVRAASQAGLTAIALTDHDTIAGIADAADEARLLGIDFLPGIEISCEYPRPGTLHMLGYGIRPGDPTLARMTANLVAGRNERNDKMITLLREQGVPITLEMVKAVAGGDVIGRPHFARVLMDLGVVSNNAQAFGRYLGSGGSAYVDKERLSAKRAIGMIHAAGGIACLAHPTQLRKENSAQVRQEIKNLADFGLDAVEVIHSDHRDSVVAELTEIADDYGLLKTGGSDFHGSNKPHIALGTAHDRRIPRAFYEAIVARLRRLSESGQGGIPAAREREAEPL